MRPVKRIKHNLRINCLIIKRYYLIILIQKKMYIIKTKPTLKKD